MKSLLNCSFPFTKCLFANTLHTVYISTNFSVTNLTFAIYDIKVGLSTLLHTRDNRCLNCSILATISAEKPLTVAC